MAAKSIEEVLREEVEFIHGAAILPAALSQDQQKERKEFNADKRKDANPESDALQPRYEFYRVLNQLNRAALCCSGGGIRSATFCLGVIQALAAYNLNAPAPQPPSRAPKPGQGKADDDKAGKAEPLHHHDAAKHAAEAKAPTHHAVEGALAPAPAAGASRKAVAATALEEEPAKPAPGKHDAPATGARPALGCFHYLSTVSGGGYIGSWLSSWRMRADFETVIKNLTHRPHGPDIEPPEISWLRAYSNYLTPRLGIASADSWAAVAICLRNLVLNWLVIIPIVCLLLLALKLIATLGVLIAHWSSCLVLLVLALGILCLIFAQAFTTRHRPSRRASGDKVQEQTFLRRDLLWAALSAVAVTIFFSSQYFASWLDEKCNGFAAVEWNGLSPQLTLPLIAAAAGFVIYGLGWSLGHALGRVTNTPLSANQWRSDLGWWAASGLVYGGIVGLGAYLFTRLGPYANTVTVCSPSMSVSHLLLPTILGVPWILMAQMVAEIVFVGLTCGEDNSDADREWLGRAAGWLAAVAVVWALTAFLVFAGGYFVQQGIEQLQHRKLIDAGAITGLLSGLVTALLGASSKTPAKKSSTGDQSGWMALASNIVLAVAGPIFVAVLIVALSVVLDRLLLDGSLVETLQNGTAGQLLCILPWLLLGGAILFLAGRLASHHVNINRFSLHALYRNRLTRCYLGASNTKRDPDTFSGFDFDDNLCVSKLWPPRINDDTKINSYSLFHVVNIALNVVSTKRLAWQERKAESFTVSPLHGGSAYLGYRESQTYGGDGGLSLGTAMAISGAAVSPNMGYHSSPSIALLLTLFNVRLGWWLGNPGEAGEKTYQFDGPKRAGKLLFDEALGQTTDQNPYVYLSDGGHFENLGLYEMVRRRCRLIVLIDAGCDGDFAFVDLGNAVRKIYIDLGIRITFEGLDELKNRPTGKSLSRAVRDAAALINVRVGEKTLEVDGAGSKPGETAEPGAVPYYAVGTIHYEDADHFGRADQSEGPGNGYILYIKPAYHGTESSAGIRSYARANPDFPHETTTDQWFTESQFESYRSLGLDIANNILGQEIELRPDDPMTNTGRLTFHDALKKLVVCTAPTPPLPSTLPPAPAVSL